MDQASYEKIIIEDPDFPIVVLENDKTSSGSQQLCPLHWHEHLELHYICEGSLHIRVNQNVYLLEQGDLIVINGNEIHSSSITGRLKERILIFRLSDLSQNLARIVPAFQQIIRQDARIGQIMSAFEEEYTNRAIGCDVASKAHLMQLVVHLARNYMQSRDAEREFSKRARKLERLKPAMDYITLHYSEDFGSEELAALVFLSKDRFNHLFKECVGVPLRTYVNDIRLHTAKAWLEDGVYSPVEAAAQAGFTDYNHFGRQFRKMFGCTPSRAAGEKTAK